MTESNAGKVDAFRALHQRDAIFVVPNPWDVGSARILAGMGFEALATTSAGMAFALGASEGSVSPQQTLDHCRSIVEATPLPVTADLEKGFGDSPESVADTIRAAAETGLAGCSIEDYTQRRDDPIFDFALAVERIAAAAEACRALPGDMLLTARAENFLWQRADLDDTIRRLQAFSNAGADVLYAPGLPDIDSVRRLCAEVDKPVNVVTGLPGRRFRLDELADAGVKRVSIGGAFARAAYGSLVSAAREITGQGSFTFADGLIGFAELDAFFEPYGPD
jgi:2-methylisocitrate lyase-like PEP mutase family enzyme